MEKMSHSEYVAEQRGRAVKLASRIVAGEPDVLETVQALAHLRHEVDLPEDDADFMVIAGIEDDLENLPIGRQRALWAAEAIQAKAAEVAEREAWAKEDARDACLSIIQRFTTG
jgi:hypothetical protein